MSDLKIVYLSGPMSRLPVAVYTRRFKEAEEFYHDQGYEVVNPCNLILKDATYDELLENDLIHLRKCTHIALLNGWLDSKGSNIELKEAKDLGLKIIRYSNLNY